jgi:hypothetical protein
MFSLVWHLTPIFAKIPHNCNQLRGCVSFREEVETPGNSFWSKWWWGLNIECAKEPQKIKEYICSCVGIKKTTTVSSEYDYMREHTKVTHIFHKKVEFKPFTLERTLTRAVFGKLLNKANTPRKLHNQSDVSVEVSGSVKIYNRRNNWTIFGFCSLRNFPCRNFAQKSIKNQGIFLLLVWLFSCSAHSSSALCNQKQAHPATKLLGMFSKVWSAKHLRVDGDHWMTKRFKWM